MHFPYTSMVEHNTRMSEAFGCKNSFIELGEQMVVLCFNPALHRFLTSATVHLCLPIWLMKPALLRHSLPSMDCIWITAGPLELWIVMLHSASLNVDHCTWTDRAIADWAELGPTFWHAPSRTCWTFHSYYESSSTDAWWCLPWLHLEESLHWWPAATQEEEQAHCPRWDWSCWPIQKGGRGGYWSPNQHWWDYIHHHWQPLRLCLTLWSYFEDLTEHCYVDWTTEVLEAGSVRKSTLAHCTTYAISLFMLITDCVLSLSLASLRSLHVLYRMWHWSTESMSRGSAKTYMHCTHTTAHSMTLSSTLTAWLKSLWKRLTESTLDWLGLLTVSCTGERS